MCILDACRGDVTTKIYYGRYRRRYSHTHACQSSTLLPCTVINWPLHARAMLFCRTPYRHCNAAPRVCVRAAGAASVTPPSCWRGRDNLSCGGAGGAGIAVSECAGRGMVAELDVRMTEHTESRSCARRTDHCNSLTRKLARDGLGSRDKQRHQHTIAWQFAAPTRSPEPVCAQCALLCRRPHAAQLSSGLLKGALLHGLGKLVAQHVQGVVGRQQQLVEARLRLWQVGPPLCVCECLLVRHHLRAAAHETARSERQDVAALWRSAQQEHAVACPI
jgi:hypothetical protein